MTTIGLIAGNGTFPFLVLRAARQLGHRVTVVAIKDETFPELEALAAELARPRFTGSPSDNSASASAPSSRPA